MPSPPSDSTRSPLSIHSPFHSSIPSCTLNGFSCVSRPCHSLNEFHYFRFLSNKTRPRFLRLMPTRLQSAHQTIAAGGTDFFLAKNISLESYVSYAEYHRGGLPIHMRLEAGEVLAMEPFPTDGIDTRPAWHRSWHRSFGTQSSGARWRLACANPRSHS